MKAAVITPSTLVLGKKYRISQENAPSSWAKGIITGNYQIDYVLPTKVHANASDVVYVTYWNKQGAQVTTNSELLAIGYQGTFDLIEYIEEVKYNLDDILGNLDKLEKKVTKKKSWF